MLIIVPDRLAKRQILTKKFVAERSRHGDIRDHGEKYVVPTKRLNPQNRMRRSLRQNYFAKCLNYRSECARSFERSFFLRT